MEFLVNRGYSLRQAQSDTQYVILSSSKDDTPRRLRAFGTVPLRRAQSDSVGQSDSGVQSNSGAQRDTRPVILSSSKDDPIERLRIGDPVTLRQAQSDIQPVILSSSKDDPIEGLKY